MVNIACRTATTAWCVRNTSCENANSARSYASQGRTCCCGVQRSNSNCNAEVEGTIPQWSCTARIDLSGLSVVPTPPPQFLRYYFPQGVRSLRTFCNEHYRQAPTDRIPLFIVGLFSALLTADRKRYRVVHGKVVRPPVLPCAASVVINDSKSYGKNESRLATFWSLVLLQ